MTTIVMIRPRLYTRRVPLDPRDPAWQTARDAIRALEECRAREADAQQAMYEAVRSLAASGATRPEIVGGLGLRLSLVKWILDNRAAARRARREPPAPGDQ